MKKLLISALLLVTGSGFGQAKPGNSPFPDTSIPASATVTEQLVAVSKSDVYCAGFITKQQISKSNFVAGGLNSPYATYFGDRDLIFLKGKYEAGSRVSIIRETRNPDAFEVYSGADKMLAQAGQPYADIGYATVVELRSDVAVAKVEFACEPILPGDLAIPFVERPEIAVRPTSTLDRFPAEKPSLAGKIAMIREYNQFAGAGQKVYINIGWEKGVKCGDYFRVTRSYSPRDTDVADAGTFTAVPIDDTQKNPPRIGESTLKNLPRRVIGEMVILNVTPSSATGMITFSLEEIHAGDNAELEPAESEAVSTAGTH